MPPVAALQRDAGADHRPAPQYATTGRFLRITQVIAETSLSRATIYRLVAKGEFPPPVHLTVRRVAWMEGAIQQWKESQLAAPPN